MISKPGPWPDVATARTVLRYLCGLADDCPPCGAESRTRELATWLLSHELGPLAYARCQAAYPALAGHLQADSFLAAAENSMHGAALSEMRAAFSTAGVPIVLLKGAALAGTVYDGANQRPMSDVDIWLQPRDMERAARAMQRVGFAAVEKPDRPWSMQRFFDGEIQFHRADWAQSLVELHFSPFVGMWLKRTAVIDLEGLWTRKEPLPDMPHVHQLAPEDMLIHLAVHTAVNHQFGLTALRSLVDMTLTAQKRPVNWQIVAQRARRWRVATVTWQTLALLQALITLPAADPALHALRPSHLRRRLLRYFVTPVSVVAGDDLQTSRMRRLLLLTLLVDRPRDMARLAFRTLWPESAWLEARYGRSVSHLQHLWHVLRRRQV